MTTIKFKDISSKDILIEFKVEYSALFLRQMDQKIFSRSENYELVDIQDDNKGTLTILVEKV